MRVVVRSRVALRLLLSLLPFLFAAACARPTPASPVTPIPLRLVASPGLKPLAQELAKAFEARATYQFRDSGSTSLSVSVREARLDAARAAVLAGDADLALVREDAEFEPPAGLRTVAIGREAVVVAVHPDNPVRTLTWAQLQAIYTGEVWDWHAIDPRWEPQEILVVVQHEGAPTRRAFERRVMRGKPITRRAVIAPGDAAAHALIASDPSAIGYLAASFVDAGVHALRIGGLAPTPEAVTAGAWPLWQPLWLLYSPDASVYALDFVDFVRGAKGQAVIARRYGRAH